MRWKLSARTFVRLWNTHSWIGMVVGLVLYPMILSGAIVLFRGQIEVWQEPWGHGGTANPIALHDRLEAGLAVAGHVPKRLWIHLPTREGAVTQLEYEVSGTDDWRTLLIDSQGSSVPAREGLAEFIYGLHFLWFEPAPWLMYVGGLVSAAWLLAIVTGVLVHLKDLVRQWAQFRPHKPRLVWSDLHKVTAVLGLPFQMMYAYTGALLVLGPVFLLAFVDPVFGGDQDRAQQVAWGLQEKAGVAPLPLRAGGGASPAPTLDKSLALVRAVEPRLKPATIELTDYGKPNAFVEVAGPLQGVPLATGALRLRQRDQTVVATRLPDHEHAAAALRRWTLGLHEAAFGGIAVRMLLFVLALGSAATIVTGNWLWLARRRHGQLTAFLSRLTVGVGAGTIVALAALFFASRVLPLELSDRIGSERQVFAMTLAAALGWAFLVENPASLWWKQFLVASILLVAVPPLHSRTSAAGLFGTGPAIDTVVAVDGGIAGVGLALAFVALWLRRNRARSKNAPEPGTVAPCS